MKLHYARSLHRRLDTIIDLLLSAKRAREVQESNLQRFSSSHWDSPFAQMYKPETIKLRIQKLHEVSARLQKSYDNTISELSKCSKP